MIYVNFLVTSRSMHIYHEFKILVVSVSFVRVVVEHMLLILVAYAIIFCFIQCSLLTNFDILVAIFKYSLVKVYKLYTSSAVLSDNVNYFMQMQTFVNYLDPFRDSKHLSNSSLFRCCDVFLVCFVHWSFSANI